MTAHVVSNDVLVSDRWVRQRCVWCGVLILDEDVFAKSFPTEDYERMMEGVDQSDPTAVARALCTTWPPGRLVDISGEFPKVTELLEDSDRFPEDSCMALDPAVTA